MTICLINNLYPPYARGGAETVVVEEAKRLLSEGHRVCVITSVPRRTLWSPVISQTNEDGVNVYRFAVPNIAWYGHLHRHGYVYKMLWHGIDVWNWLSAAIVQNILAQEGVQEVHTHNLMGIGFTIPRVIQRLRLRHVHTLHDIQLVQPSGVLPWNHARDSWGERVYSAIMKRQFGRPDVIVTPSRFLQRFYEKRGFFELSEWQVHKNTVLADRQIEAPQSSDFLYVGALESHKGVNTLMRAWDRAKTMGRTLHIVGSGTLTSTVKRWAASRNNVRLYGRLEREEVEKIYKQGHTLLFTSVCIENSPMVLVEAVSYRLPIIAAGTGGVTELLEGYKKSTIITPGDAEKLAQVIGSTARYEK